MTAAFGSIWFAGARGLGLGSQVWHVVAGRIVRRIEIRDERAAIADGDGRVWFLLRKPQTYRMAVAYLQPDGEVTRVARVSGDSTGLATSTSVWTVQHRAQTATVLVHR